MTTTCKKIDEMKIQLIRKKLLVEKLLLLVCVKVKLKLNFKKLLLIFQKNQTVLTD